MNQKLSILYIRESSKLSHMNSGVMLNSRLDWLSLHTKEFNAPDSDANHALQDLSTNSQLVRPKKKLQRTFMSSRVTSVLDNSFIRIRAESRVKSQLSSTTIDKCDTETSYTIRPASWLIRLGFHHGLRLSWGYSCIGTQGWKQTLEPLRLVPDDALIFEYCQEGNVDAVRTLLTRNASVRDTDSFGYTPLHVSTSRQVYIA